MIFFVRLDDVDRKWPKTDPSSWTPLNGYNDLQTTFTVSGDANFSATGIQKMETRSGPSTGNVYLHVGENWNGAPIIVTATVADNAPDPVVQPHEGTRRDKTPPTIPSWTLVPRDANNIPTTITRVGGSEEGRFVAEPASFIYRVGRKAPPTYRGQTVMEEFGPASAAGYFGYGDLEEDWRRAHPDITTAEEAARILFTSGDNSTFVVDGSNQIYDAHGGFWTPPNSGPDDFTPAAKIRGIGVSMTQTYTAGPNNPLGKYKVDKKYVAGVVTINKSRQ